MLILAIANAIFWIIGFLFLYRTISRQQSLESRLAALEHSMHHSEPPAQQ